MEFGYTMMSEQSGPLALVGDAVDAEAAGFDFAVISDHYFPWLPEQGHAPFAWSVLAATAQATSTLPLMTFVTCPILRYHPTVVAQMAATTALLSNDRFTLGLGAGENLNEHVVGRDWPPVDVRHEMLTEAVQVIRRLLAGEDVTFRGRHLDTASAKLWDLPTQPVPVGIAVSGRQSCQLAGEYADVLIAVEPKAELGAAFDAAGGAGKPRYGQLPICYDPDPAAARRRAHEQLRWFGAGWKVNAELPGPSAFAAASQFVREDDVAEAIPCGADVEAVVEAVRPWREAGFTHLALLQVGEEHQKGFLDWAEKDLLPTLRSG
ncbi:MAG: TIGR03557 family F420-dependent LLM class oxidoreductase [Sporichthyaceae bacterium]